MNYAEAKKTVQSSSVKEGYMLINMAYNIKVVLPHKAGVDFLQSLALAEQLHEEYQKPHFIGPVNRDTFTATILSRQEYENYKMATLLGISVSDMKDMADSALTNKSTQTTPP
jgi:hypothetical protein